MKETNSNNDMRKNIFIPSGTVQKKEIKFVTKKSSQTYGEPYFPCDTHNNRYFED